MVAHSQYQIRKITAPLFVLLFSIGWYAFSTKVLDGANQQIFQAGRFGAYVTPQYFHAYIQAVEISMTAVAILALVVLLHSLFDYFKSVRLSSQEQSHA